MGGLGPRGAAQLFHRKSVNDKFEARDFGEPCANTEAPFQPGEVAIEDVNDDGRPDLLLAGKRLAVYYAGLSGTQKERFSSTASWCSEEELGYSPSVQVAHVTDPKRTLVTVSRSCVDLREPCPPGGWLVYNPAASTTRLWERDAPVGTVAGPAVLTSLPSATGDDVPDLLVSMLYDPKQPQCFGAAMQLYPGRAHAPHEPAEFGTPWHPDYEPVASKLLPVNLYRKKCADLLVVSAHPATPPALFVEAGPCATE